MIENKEEKSKEISKEDERLAGMFKKLKKTERNLKEAEKNREKK